MRICILDLETRDVHDFDHPKNAALFMWGKDFERYVTYVRADVYGPEIGDYQRRLEGMLERLSKVHLGQEVYGDAEPGRDEGDTVRIRRVVDVVGPRRWAEQTMRKSVSGRMDLGKDAAIVEVSRKEMSSAIIKYEREELNAPSSVETEPDPETGIEGRAKVG